MRQSGIDRQVEHYKRDPFYRFTEGEARELADEVLRLRERQDLEAERDALREALCNVARAAEIARVLNRHRQNGNLISAREVEIALQESKADDPDNAGSDAPAQPPGDAKRAWLR
jgi:hypothetical protein